MGRRSGAWLLGAIVVVIVTACSSASSPAATGGTQADINACDVVTTDMVAAALGGSFATGSGASGVTAPGSGSACSFAANGLIVAVLPGGRRVFDGLRPSATGVVDVSGVAEGAYYSHDSGVFVFLKGDTVGELIASNGAYNDQTKLAALASAVASRL